MTVPVGKEFEVRLSSSPTTGYIWQVAKLPESIQLSGSGSENVTSDLRPGDPTTQVFRFRTLKPGEGPITFSLKRPWESEAGQTHQVTVKSHS